MIPLPDPPLVWPPHGESVGEVPQERGTSTTGSRDLALLLRPWRLTDAPALVAAWADPEIQRWTGVSERRDLRAAQRWIAGDEARRARDLSLDLAVERGGVVAGEVGLVPHDAIPGVLELGWWVAPEHRGRGIASAAARLLAAWAQTELACSVMARCDPTNPASGAVAANAGLRSGWTGDAGEVWVQP